MYQKRKGLSVSGDGVAEMHVIETKIVNSFLGGQGRKKGGKIK